MAMRALPNISSFAAPIALSLYDGKHEENHAKYQHYEPCCGYDTAESIQFLDAYAHCHESHIDHHSEVQFAEPEPYREQDEQSHAEDHAKADGHRLIEAEEQQCDMDRDKTGAYHRNVLHSLDEESVPVQGKTDSCKQVLHIYA